MIKYHPLSTIGFVLLIISAAGCDSIIRDSPRESEPVPGIDSPLSGGDVEILVLEASIRKNYQTHYIMTHAEPPYIFYDLVVSIQDIEDPLLWGEQNLRLRYGEDDLQLAKARPLLLGEDVQYKVGEDFSFGYEYIYNIPEDSEYSQVYLALPDGREIELGSILQFSSSPLLTSGAQPDLGTISGGSENSAYGQYSTVSGGSYNASSAYHTTIGGGNLNIASASHAVVGGGRENAATYFYATVGGGYANTASGRDSTIAGGSRNTADHHHATISGGIQNVAAATDATVAGGSYNHATGVYAVVAGGTRNLSSGYAAAITGGAGNTASGDHSVVGGGLGNQVSGLYSVVGAGHGNIARGNYSTIPGGTHNTVLGNFSFAAGQRSYVSENHPGVFIYADSSNYDFTSVAPNEFAVRATGGVRFVTALDENGDPSTGVFLPAGSGSWAAMSDRAVKTDFVSVDNLKILESLSTVPIASWAYSSQDSGIRHIGPVAQDFYASFQLGEDSRYINMVDADGVALASIQGLYQLVQDQEGQLSAQQTRINDLEARLNDLETAGVNHNNSSQRILNPLWIGLLVLSLLGWFLKGNQRWQI